MLWNFINYRNNKLNNQVHLLLIPTITTTAFKKLSIPAWHIINLSNFNISIQEIGFASVRRTFPFFRKKILEKKIIPFPIPIQIPIRGDLSWEHYDKSNIKPLASREAIILATDFFYDIDFAINNHHYMYAITVCGHEVIADARSILNSIDISNFQK